MLNGIGDGKCAVHEVAYGSLGVGGIQREFWAYVMPKPLGCDVLLGEPWAIANKVMIDPSTDCLIFKDLGITIQQDRNLPSLEVRELNAHAFVRATQKLKQKSGSNVFAASLADIDKMLNAPQELKEVEKHIPNWIREELREAFDRSKADQLPPSREGVDHRIERLKDEKGKPLEAPFGPLYSMTRDELLLLRKTLTELLDKGFIRVSKSAASAPVLFAKMPSGKLRFCVDYRALNKITKKDRYPLPLIQETLQRISKARWFTKLDVIHAFHRVRIEKGDEWLTAFRTRFGLYEWVVMPFGLCNGPSAFQRFINHVLSEFLDDFASAYVDDVLIYTNGSKEEHYRQVNLVLQRLLDSGLHVDIKKCEFCVTETKYLGFIIEAGKALKMDPAKTQAIRDWKPPTTVKGVRGFLGFANFYRQFIKDFSALARPLTLLTGKDVQFNWTPAADTSFHRLKEAFLKAPVLAQYHPERPTRVETDSSGYSVGGALSQANGHVYQPVAFFSKRMTPAECNYEIYDKELLAIVVALREWSSQLRGVTEFEIITDHKNLEYFTTTRKLSERQIRWWQELSRYNFCINYRPGKNNAAADALSRREQDMPMSDTDERLQCRNGQLLKMEKHMLKVSRAPFPDSKDDDETLWVGPAQLDSAPDKVPDEIPESLQNLWFTAISSDSTYLAVAKAIKEGSRTLSPALQLRITLAECQIDNHGFLRWRQRLWVPNSEPLRTGLIHYLHDSIMSGHPGRANTNQLVARWFFWPRYSDDIRRFCRNCGICGRTKVWRDRKQGFLKPLPIPERQWRDIAMDFIGPLPKSEGYDMILVITDRLSKGVILEPCNTSISTEQLIELFIRTFYRHHGLPTSIVSDRGPQFISMVWKRFCERLHIKRRLSTAYHPQTDGATERKNAEVEQHLRVLLNDAQDDWASWLPIVQLQMNGGVAASTQIAPFFWSHGYDLEITQDSREHAAPSTRLSPIVAADKAVDRITRATQWAQAAMANAQQQQEVQANRSRKASPSYQVGDKVWLDLRNVKTERPSKKLDSRYAKFTVVEVVGPLSYRLDTPPGIHAVFHTDRLKLASEDPHPSQQLDDAQPPPFVVDGENEYQVEEILAERRKKIGRGFRHEYRVKWSGYVKPTWEPADALEDTVALDEYINRNVMST